MNQYKNALLIIDGQYDFCHPNGALFVPGADEDMNRLAGWINRNAHSIDLICFTLDQHFLKAIFHPIWFCDAQGNHPAPFTTITVSDLTSGKWIANYEPEKTLLYLSNLELQGQFLHTIWHPHCILGTRGASLYEPLAEEILRWATTGKEFVPITKGLHPLTEHYGVFQAQIPITDEPTTHLDTRLLNLLNQYERVFVAGEAKSHCVAVSLEQVMEHAPELAGKMILLEDCMSPVPGFDHLADTIYHKANDLMSFTRSDSTVDR